jgi:hypothetical protein
MKFESPSVIAKTVQTTWWDVLKAGWRLWPIAHLVTYSIPRDHRWERPPCAYKQTYTQDFVLDLLMTCANMMILFSARFLPISVVSLVQNPQRHSVSQQSTFSIKIIFWLVWGFDVWHP